MNRMIGILIIMVMALPHSAFGQTQLSAQVRQDLATISEFANEGELETALFELNKLKGQQLSPIDRDTVIDTLVDVLAMQGELGYAIGHFAAIESSPHLSSKQKSFTLLNIARGHLIVNEYDRAIELLSRNIADFSDEIDPNAYYLLAASYYQLDELENALAPAEMAVALLGSQSKPAHDILNAIYYRLDQVSIEKTPARSLKSLEEESAAIDEAIQKYCKKSSEKKTGNRDIELFTYVHNLDCSPEFDELMANLSKANSPKSNYVPMREKRIELLENMLDFFSDDGSIHAQLAGLYRQAGRDEAALLVLDNAYGDGLTLNESRIKELATLHADVGGSLERGAQVLDESIRNGNLSRISTNFTFLAEFWLQAGDHDKYRAALKEAAPLSGSNDASMYYFRIAKSYFESELFEESVEYFDLSIQMGTYSRRDAFYFRGVALFLMSNGIDSEKLSLAKESLIEAKNLGSKRLRLERFLADIERAESSNTTPLTSNID